MEEEGKKRQPVAARVELPFVCACEYIYVRIDGGSCVQGTSKEDESARGEHTKGGTDIM